MFTRGTVARRKTGLTALAVAATAAIGLAGCAGGGGGGGGGGDVEITYGLWNEVQAPAMEQIIDAFEAENEGITVTLQVTPWEQYWTKLQTAATGGSAPDVFWMNLANFPQYADGGALASLQDLADSGDIDMANYIDAMAESYTWEGEVYGVPKDIDSIGLWYNKTMFEEAGIPAPDETWTWDDVRDAAEQLTDPDAGVWGIASQIAPQQGYYNTIPQAGGYVVSDDKTESGFDKPEAIEGIQYWVDFIEKGHSPTLAQQTDTEPSQMFTAGKVAMLYEGSWNAAEFDLVPYAQENIDVAPLPQGEQPGGVVNGLANVLFANSPHPEEAKKFLAFLGSEEAAQIQADTGIVIPAFKGEEIQQAWVESFPNYNLASFLPGLEYGMPLPSSLNTAEWAGYAEEEFTKAWSLQEPVDVVAKRVADHMNEVLAAEQEG
jgi:multiple sugar transport system substrate-binding protein